MNAPLPPASYPSPAPHYYGPHVPPGGPSRRRHWTVLGLVAAAVGIAAAGAVGVYVGARISQPSSATAASADTVHSQTVDLCTRFAGGYRAMPTPQRTAFDIIPTANYIADALRDNPLADSTIRNAVSDSLALTRSQAARLSGEAARGAIQPPTDWSVDVANHADQRVWDLCRAYQ